MIDIDLTNENERAKQVLEQIDLKEKRLTDKTNVITQLEYEKRLIEKDIVDTIKTELNASSINIFRGFNPSLLDDIWRWFANKDENKQLEDTLDFILNIIKSKLLNNDDNFKLKNIIDFYYSTAYQFIFDYKGQVIIVNIPVFANVTEKNKSYIMCGYMIQYTKNENVWSPITYGFDTDKISQDLKEWCKNE